MFERRLSLALISSLILVFAGCSGSDQDGADPGSEQQRDAGTSDSNPSDTRDEGDVGLSDDASADTSGGQGVDADASDGGDDGGDAGDGGRTCSAQKDDDGDGLDNCEEAEMCTDPSQKDTDGDQLNDLEEIELGTDPCNPDTDGDGVSDGKEVKFGLDPTKEKTDGETLDKNRWILDACQKLAPRAVQFHANQAANWNVALPQSYSNYTELTLADVPRHVAAAVYDDTSRSVAGSIFTKDASASQDSPRALLLSDISIALSNVGTVTDALIAEEFDTHDNKRAVSGEYSFRTATKKSVRKLRKELLVEFASFDQFDAAGFPPNTGSGFSKFRIEVSVIRGTSGGDDRFLILFAVAPASKYGSSPGVRADVDDLTETSNVASQYDLGHSSQCDWFKWTNPNPKVEFYWVLDQSRSMETENSKLESLASAFQSNLDGTSLDYRFGVTNMHPHNDGRLHVPPGWHDTASTLSSEFRNRVTQCMETQSWICGDWNMEPESGLEVAVDGLRYMLGVGNNAPGQKEKIRSGAKIVTILMSDEAAQGDPYPRDSDSSPVPDALDFLKDRTRVYSIVAGPDGDCASDLNPPVGYYEEVARRTGGAYTDLCKAALDTTLQNIVRESAALAEPLTLDETPVTSSIRVYVDGEEVSRGGQNGYRYLPGQNAIVFFGDAKPSEEGSYVVVQYETFNAVQNP